jgi:hypothetical protein
LEGSLNLSFSLSVIGYFSVSAGLVYALGESIGVSLSKSYQALEKLFADQQYQISIYFFQNWIKYFLKLV